MLAAMVRGPRSLLTFAVACLAFAPAATAGANVTIGSPNTAATVLGVSGDCVCVHSPAAIPGSMVTSPVNGTVVRWTVQWNGSGSARFRVIRPLTGASALFVSSGATTPVPILTHSFDTSQAISIGDRIGVEDAAVDGALGNTTPTAGASFDTWNPAPADGASPPAPTANSPGELLLNAEIRPTNTFTSAVRSNKKKGTATLTLQLPNAGSVEIGGGPVRPQTAAASAAGALTLKLTPTKKARKRLRTKGKAKGSIAVAFKPNFGDSAQQAVPLTLKRKR